MRAVLQRVKQARVTVDGRETGAIGAGLLVLLGVHRDDTPKDVTWMADKVVNLRIFEDEQGRMNRSVIDIAGEILVVSQFTLLGDCRKGRRPSWSHAAPPEMADRLYRDFVRAIEARGIRTATGEFQAMMEVSLVNSGPVTMLLDSHKIF
ncbi:D-aminoacyl-tRNA deacylase [Desulfolithobacter dissulfuricans]|uniref:D-aminoacyl-tRNA deacylase n=1 Tax=Desulfolithobacter dissulfuricans TaxID=2795293 RepID=A0A915XJN9_9BACT|nr:D-aminoacyl-tRNA deacylase [Desulfolithobacter dissulfuricans]BCO10570.1 D-aminoacyl-tRNA deacylase [Desulfolithobacter dissulfuricans]